MGAFDSKAPEYAFLHDALLAQGVEVVSINFGILGSTKLFPVDVDAAQVMAAAGHDLSVLRTAHDRGRAMQCAAEGLAALLPALVREKAIHGVIGMGGSSGTSVIAAGLRALPIGLPKVCISTVAGGNVEPYIGIKDIVLIPSIVDIAGINRISRQVIWRAAGAIAGMVRVGPAATGSDKPTIAATMFGNTTACVDACALELSRDNYEVVVFHATGTGGRAMESLVADGMIDAVLDLTTTEWADTIAGGVFDAGRDRLSAPGLRGIPHLIGNGCIDMVNFGTPASIPTKYSGRNFHVWNPAVTLMRTNVAENREMGRIFAEKANAARGPVAFILAKRGVSMLDEDGGPFCDRVADEAFTIALKRDLNPSIEVVELDVAINDPVFSKTAVKMLRGLIAQSTRKLAPL